MGFEPTTSSLEGWSSTAELHPQSAGRRRNERPAVEGDGFEPSKAWSRQIYSLLPLATREPLLMSSRLLVSTSWGGSERAGGGTRTRDLLIKVRCSTG